MYKPLPDGLYIGSSMIEGQGVYTSRALSKSCQLGDSHYRIATNDIPSFIDEENKTIMIGKNRQSAYQNIGLDINILNDLRDLNRDNTLGFTAAPLP